jgi:hypothetical protein
MQSERYRPSGILIHRQNLYVPRSKRLTGRREAQSLGNGQQSENTPCTIVIVLVLFVAKTCPTPVILCLSLMS